MLIIDLALNLGGTDGTSAGLLSFSPSGAMSSRSVRRVKTFSSRSTSRSPNNAFDLQGHKIKFNSVPLICCVSILGGPWLLEWEVSLLSVPFDGSRRCPGSPGLPRFGGSLVKQEHKLPILARNDAKTTMVNVIPLLVRTVVQ